MSVSFIPAQKAAVTASSRWSACPQQRPIHAEELKQNKQPNWDIKRTTDVGIEGTLARRQRQAAPGLLPLETRMLET